MLIFRSLSHFSSSTLIKSLHISKYVVKMSLLNNMELTNSTIYIHTIQLPSIRATFNTSIILRSSHDLLVAGWIGYNACKSGWWRPRRNRLPNLQHRLGSFLFQDGGQFRPVWSVGPQRNDDLCQLNFLIVLLLMAD